MPFTSGDVLVSVNKDTGRYETVSLVMQELCDLIRGSNMVLDQLAFKCKVSVHTLENWLAGRIFAPRHDTGDKVARFFGYRQGLVPLASGSRRIGLVPTRLN